MVTLYGYAYHNTDPPMQNINHEMDVLILMHVMGWDTPCVMVNWYLACFCGAIACMGTEFSENRYICITAMNCTVLC